MTKTYDYIGILLSCSDPREFLMSNSNLPGPRSNLELLYAFIEVSRLEMVEAILEKRYAVTPVNQPEEFVLCCAVAACGKHILNGNDYLIEKFRDYASDERWRVRKLQNFLRSILKVWQRPVLR